MLSTGGDATGPRAGSVLLALLAEALAELEDAEGDQDRSQQDQQDTAGVGPRWESVPEDEAEEEGADHDHQCSHQEVRRRRGRVRGLAAVRRAGRAAPTRPRNQTEGDETQHQPTP